MLMFERDPAAPVFLVAAQRDVKIDTLAAVADLLGDCFASGRVLFVADDFGPDFFNLRTGLAGELLQKLTNYQIRAAFVLAQPQQYGARFAELAYEHAHHPLLRFFVRDQAALDWLLAA